MAGLTSAIQAANGNGTPDTICLTDSTYTLTAVDNTTDGANGLPSITGDLTLAGNGATIARDPAAPAFRLVHVAAGGSLTLENVTLSGGLASGSAPGDDGGAVYNRGTLTLINSTLSGNSAATDGGALLAVGGVTLRAGSTIANNTAGDDGGGLYVTNSSLTVLDSSIANNSAGDQGGGLRAVGSSLSFANSQLSGNSAPAASGGGLFATSTTLTFSGGAVSGNSASSGGGLYLTNSPAPAQLENGVQITNNSATSGGGLYISTDGQVALTNATVSGNQASSSAAGIWAGGTVTLTTSTVANNGNTTQPGSAGGIRAAGGTLTLLDSAISGNTVNSASGLGAGVYVAGAGSAALSGGTVSDNTAARGGGLYSTGSLTLGATVVGNTAASHGGGLYVAGGAAVVTASTFDGNTAGDRGGGILNNAALQVETSRFSANHADGRGGAVYLGSVTDSWLWTSCLAGNTSSDTGGVYSAPSGFDAANNWWGAADGPSGAGAGSGDAVNGNVGFTPFVTTECPAGTGAGGAGLAALQTRSPRLLTTPTLTPLRLPLSFTFEDETGWQADGAWLLDTLSGHASAPSWAVSTVSRDQDNRLELSAPLALGRGRTPRLRVWLRGQLAASDQARVEVLPQGASAWETVAQWTSIPANWAEQAVDLSAYRGQTVRLRVRVVAGGELSAGERSTGLWLDDLTLDTR